MPAGSAGITLGRLIVLRRRHASIRLLRHELVHVRQFVEQGPVRFLARYLGSYLLWRMRGYPHQGAYRRIPHEIEAYWLERFADPPDPRVPAPEEETVPPAP